MVADLQVDHPEARQDLLPKDAACLSFRYLEVSGNLGQVFVHLSGYVRGHVRGGAAGEGERGGHALPGGLLGQ